MIYNCKRVGDLHNSAMKVLCLNKDLQPSCRPLLSSLGRFKLQFYDDSNFNVVDDLYEHDRMRTTETHNAFEYISSLLG